MSKTFQISFLILFICLFSSSFVFFTAPFEFYFHYIIIVLLFPIFLFRIGVPKFYLFIFLIPLTVGLVHIILKNNHPFTFIKIFGGLSVTLLFFYYIIVYNKFNLIDLFKIYCKCCWILVIISLIQILSFFIGFKYGYHYSWVLNKWGFVEGGIIGFRVNSILSEPTYLATSLSPAVYVSINNLLSKKKLIFKNYQSILIIIVTILTTSTVGYLGILFSILLISKTIRLRYIVIGLIISFFGFTLAYNNVKDFKSRVDAAKGLWFENDFRIQNTNNSSFVLYNNLHIAKENLLKHPLFGTGLGSHETAFNRFTLTKSLIQYDFEFNIKDGNSLFIRLCTETGILGLSFIILIIIKGFIYRVDEQNELLLNRKIISQSIFILLILVLIRQGNYMLNGLPLLFLLYYLNGIQYNNELGSLKNDD